MEIKENFNIQKYNSFNLNITARYFAEINTEKDLEELSDSYVIKNNDYKILGTGSNILFRKDYNGLIVKINLKGKKLIKETDNYFYVKASAGEDWDEFVDYTIKNNYQGLENLSLIPSSVGATPVQNIGAYGIELKDVFYQLEAYDIDKKLFRTFQKKECKFKYRDSVFKHEFKDKFIITNVIFKLRKRPSYKCNYADLNLELKNRNIEKPDAGIIRQIVCDIRKKKLPYPSDIGNAGSFFKNPVINEAKFTELKNRFDDLRYYELPENKYKLAAGWMIEKTGWKGKRIGDAGVHSQQALVLVNYGNASGEDIINLANKIMDSIMEKFGVLLDYEVNII